MLVELVVRCAGGFFRFKTRVQNKKSISKRFYSTLYYYYLIQHNSYIGLNTIFRNEPCFPHGVHGIFISDSAVIGRNCIIFPNVVIGSNSVLTSKGFGAPYIGDDCYIGTGATIIGNVNIGNNCRIGANATVSKDVPSNSTLVLPEPRLLHKYEADSRFYTIRNKRWVYFEDGKFRAVKDSGILNKLNTASK